MCGYSIDMYRLRLASQAEASFAASSTPSRLPSAPRLLPWNPEQRSTTQRWVQLSVQTDIYSLTCFFLGGGNHDFWAQQGQCIAPRESCVARTAWPNCKVHFEPLLSTSCPLRFLWGSSFKHEHAGSGQGSSSTTHDAVRCSKKLFKEVSYSHTLHIRTSIAAHKMCHAWNKSRVIQNHKPTYGWDENRCHMHERTWKHTSCH